MVWQQWLYLVWTVFSVMLTIAQIGKPRETITPGVALVVVVFSLGLIGLVLSI